MKNPLVSVVVITYNHQNFIVEAIESILSQKTNFEIEIILSNDQSTDDSDQLIRSFLKNHPKKSNVKYTYHNSNKGILENFKWALKKARGTYIALCDGDDYWMDTFKLKKQVSFLQNNSSFSGVASNSELQNDMQNGKVLFNNASNDKSLCVDDLLKQRYFHTASFMFRAKYLRTFKLPNVLSADRFLFLFIASKNPIYYLNEVSCVYRRNAGGISKRVTSNHMIKDLNFIKPAKTFLNKKQLLVLKTFIYKTIFQYSHQIKLSHYFFIGLKLLFITKFKRSSFQLIKKSYSKVSLNVN